jgi:hypothetical protein
LCTHSLDDNELWICGEILHHLLSKNQKKTFKRNEVKPLVKIDYTDSILKMHNRLVKFSDYGVSMISAGFDHCLIQMSIFKGQHFIVEQLWKRRYDGEHSDVQIVTQ